MNYFLQAFIAKGGGRIALLTALVAEKMDMDSVISIFNSVV